MLAPLFLQVLGPDFTVDTGVWSFSWFSQFI